MPSFPRLSGFHLLGSRRNPARSSPQPAGLPTYPGLRHLRRAKKAGRGVTGSPPKMADEPASETRRLLRCSVPVPGQESRGRKGQSPSTPVIPPGGGIRPEAQATGERSDRKAQTLLPDATGMTQTCRHTSGLDLDRTTGNPEQARRNPCADGSDVANLQRNAALDPIRRGPRDRATARRESEGTPGRNPTAPTALVRGHRPRPFPVPRSLSRSARPRPGHSKIRAPVAGVRDRPAAAPMSMPESKCINGPE